ncbi:hypothetical protein pb186bvf_013443 [Paramecium bursaria]
MQKDALVQCIVQAVLLGFQTGSDCNLVSQLRNLKCNGGTAMRDAIVLGTSLLLEMRKFHIDRGMPNIWNFLHIVITDGEDTSSKSSQQQLQAVMGMVGQNIPPQLLKTIYIGVDLGYNSQAERELRQLASYGGQGAELKSITLDQMDQLFSRIVLSLRQRVSVQSLNISTNNASFGMTRIQTRPELNVQINRYLILLTIDVSGSMDGQRHNKVVNAVNQITGTLGPEDLVCGIVFNTDCKLLSKLNVQQWNREYYASQQQQTKSQPQIQQQYQRPQQKQVPVTDKSCCCVIF